MMPTPLPTDPSPVLYVSNKSYGLDDSGRYWLRGNDHKKIVLKGINIPLVDDWDFPASRPYGKLEELAKTGANCVRIQWYAQYPAASRPPYATADLDRVLEKCRTSRLVPIVELHDCTCKEDPELVNSELMSWWTRPDVLGMLKRHERYLIINLANELGWYRWQNWSPAALDKFKVAYKKAITSIRSKGLRMPIMIDAPDCGSSVNAFLSAGQELIDHDPLHSILLSAHAYWGDDYDGSADVNLAIGAKLPIVLGEIANKQFANDNECFYGLDGTNLDNPPRTEFRYQNLLINLTQREVGWLAWAWYKDNCEHRRMTPDGNYTGAIDGSPTGLTPYGSDILHQGTYGLRLGYFKPQKLDTLPGAPPV
ncbi:glycoside hydrolase [Micromonospora sp. KC721]|nr:glycoside hydrolase [Micromonospora sp. KC721]